MANIYQCKPVRVITTWFQKCSAVVYKLKEDWLFVSVRVMTTFMTTLAAHATTG